MALPHPGARGQRDDAPVRSGGDLRISTRNKPGGIAYDSTAAPKADAQWPISALPGLPAAAAICTAKLPMVVLST